MEKKPEHEMDTTLFIVHLSHKICGIIAFLAICRGLGPKP